MLWVDLKDTFTWMCVCVSGQERYGNMTRVYYREAVGALMVFDLTRASTFDAVLKWKDDLDSKVGLWSNPKNGNSRNWRLSLLLFCYSLTFRGADVIKQYSQHIILKNKGQNYRKSLAEPNRCRHMEGQGGLLSLLQAFHEKGRKLVFLTELLSSHILWTIMCSDWIKSLDTLHSFTEFQTRYLYFIILTRWFVDWPHVSRYKEYLYNQILRQLNCTTVMHLLSLLRWL